MVLRIGVEFYSNKDMQEDKEAFFDAVDNTSNCLTLFTDMLATIKFNKSAMEKSAMMGFTNATDAADYLVNKGMPFRDAHSVIGKLVLYCIDKNCSIDELAIDELKSFSEMFDSDIYNAISLETCVNKRLTIGAPSPDAMKKVISINEEFIKNYSLK